MNRDSIQPDSTQKADAVRRGRIPFRNYAAKLALLAVLAAEIAACSSGGMNFSEEQWRSDVEKTNPEMLYAPHFKNGEFVNPWMPMADKSLVTVLEWKLRSNNNHYSGEEKAFLPVFRPDALSRIEKLRGKDFILWIGHSTFLIRAGGQYWLTDPMFSDRALLPKRKIPPGMTPDDLKKLDGPINVLITHSHYDHLDEESVRKLPASTKFFVPKGLGECVRDFGGKDVTEVDWWDTVDAGAAVRLTCLPAQHWSKRIGQPKNTTLWAGYMIQSPGATIYIAGDTGYFVGYREFRKRFPKIDYAILPAAPGQPRWLMHYAHMNTDEALRAFSDLGARYFIPAHWGAFELGDEPAGHSIVEMKRKIAELKLDPGRFRVLDVGGILAIPPAPRGDKGIR